MFDLQDNLVKLKDIFDNTAKFMLRSAPINDKIFEVVDQLSKDPEKDDVILSTL